MVIRIASFSLVLLIVTGCRSSTTTPAARNSTQTATPQTSRSTTALPPKSQRFASDRQNQLDDRGSSDGYGDGYNGSPANPNARSADLTDPTEKNIYTNAYNRGYAQGKSEQQTTPTPTPTPTSTVSPNRRVELQQWGDQDGRSDAQSGLATNPDRGVVVWGLGNNPSEQQIYISAYNAAYQASTPTATPERLSALKQQGYNDGYADAQSNASQDPNRGVTLPGLVAATERQAYINGYSSGYQAYLNSQPPPPNVLW